MCVTFKLITLRTPDLWQQKYNTPYQLKINLDDNLGDMMMLQLEDFQKKKNNIKNFHLSGLINKNHS